MELNHGCTITYGNQSGLIMEINQCHVKMYLYKSWLLWNLFKASVDIIQCEPWNLFRGCTKSIELIQGLQINNCTYSGVV